MNGRMLLQHAIAPAVAGDPPAKSGPSTAVISKRSGPKRQAVALRIPGPPPYRQKVASTLPRAQSLAIIRTRLARYRGNVAYGVAEFGNPSEFLIASPKFEDVDLGQSRSEWKKETRPAVLRRSAEAPWLLDPAFRPTA